MNNTNDLSHSLNAYIQFKTYTATSLLNGIHLKVDYFVINNSNKDKNAKNLASICVSMNVQLKKTFEMNVVKNTSERASEECKQKQKLTCLYQKEIKFP